MVRSLTAGQETARAGDGHRFHKILRLWWSTGPQDYLMRGTDEFNPDPALTYESIIIAWPDHANAASLALNDEGGPSRTAAITLAIDRSATRNIAERIRDEDPTGIQAETFVVLYTGSTLARADWIRLGRWSVENPVRSNEGQAITLSLVDFVQQLLERDVGRVVTTELISDAPEISSGLVLPLVFGTGIDVPCVLVTGGAVGTLLADITRYEGEIKIDEGVTDFAATGLLIIENEAVQYTAKSDGNFTIGTAATPVTRGWSTLREPHKAGTKVFRRIPAGDGGYHFVAADQAGATFISSKINGNTTDPDLTTENASATVAGETAAQVEFDALPAIALDTTQERVVTLHLKRFPRSITDLTGVAVSPIVATFDDSDNGRVGHQFANGDVVWIGGVSTNTNTNGWQTVANRTAKTFELAGTTGNANWTAGDGGAAYQPLIRFIEASSNNLTLAAADWDRAVEVGGNTGGARLLNNETLGVEIETGLLDAWQSDPDHPALGRITGVRAYCRVGGIATAVRQWSANPANQPLFSVYETDTAALVASLPLVSPDPTGAGARWLPSVFYEIDITEQVLTDVSNPGWDWFQAGRTLTVFMPAGATLALPWVMEIGFKVDVVDQQVELVNEDTANVTAVLNGFGGASNTAQETIEEIVTGSLFMGLTASDYDQSGLVAALSDITESPYTMDRVYDEPANLRAALSSAVRDAGIRYVIDGGQLKFFPKINSSSSDSVRSLTLADLPSPAPPEADAHIDLVSNWVRVTYDRTFRADIKAVVRSIAAITVEQALSQAYGWGERRTTLDAEWLSIVTEATELADRFIADFAFPRRLLQVPVIAGRNLDLEVGDVVKVTDAYSDLALQVGRIVGTSWIAENTIRLTLALGDEKTTLFGSGDNRVDIFTSPPRIEFWLDGNLVAALINDGLWIDGTITERVGVGSETAHTPGTLVELIASEWSLGATDGGGTLEQQVTIDANGDVLLRTLFEDITYPVAAAQSANFELDGTADPQELLVSIDLARRVALAADVTDQNFGYLTIRHLRESAW